MSDGIAVSHWVGAATDGGIFVKDAVSNLRLSLAIRFTI